MYQKEVNRRSPLRVFERSIHGGLGPGNIGLVMSRAGVGKTAFLIGVALDDLMRGRKVLHVNTEDTAEKVREFYDEVFHDLAEANELSDKNAVHLTVERNRMIHTFLGDTFSMERLQGALGYMREFMDFAPAAVILDGYPKWDTATDEQMEELKELAGKLKCELWLSSLIHRDGEEVDDISQLAGLAKTQPKSAFAMTVAMVSRGTSAPATACSRTTSSPRSALAS